MSRPATYGASACERDDGVRGPPLPGQFSVWRLAVGRFVHVTLIGDFVVSGNDWLAHCRVALRTSLGRKTCYGCRVVRKRGRC